MSGYLIADQGDLSAIPAGSRFDGLAYLLPSLGWYQFRAASTQTADDYWIVAPDAGSGRWHLISSASNRAGSPVLPLADANTITIQSAEGSHWATTMAASRATRLIAAPNAPVNGQDFRLWLRQPATPPTGGCKITLAAIWQPRQGAIALNPAPNSISLLQGQYIAEFGVIQCEVGGW